jgi:amidohydrolase
MKLVEPILADAATITAIRRDIHAHPELCYEEVRTSDVVAKALTEWGIPVHRGLGKTGLVGVIKNGSSTRAVGLRADMDALPMTEHNHFAHASTHPGKMHACGHDGHTAMLLAAAKHMARHRNFDGTVYLIFQPAEEGGAGAQAMIDDGIFTRFPMDAVFGAHNWPGMPVGTVAVSPGPMMASSNIFTLKINGKGSHAALAYMGVDPVPIACQIIMGWQTIVSRNLRAVDSGVISATMVHTGEAFNVVPQSAEVKGTVRTFAYDTLDLIERRMQEMATNICAAYGATCEFSFERNYPPTINHPKETEFLRQSLANVVGQDNVVPFEPTMGSEDFSFFLKAKPGCYFMLGNGEGAHRMGGHGLGPCTLHNPSYDFNDELIPVGASCWVRLAEDFLKPGA